VSRHDRVSGGRPPSAQKRESRPAGLRQASLAIVIVLIVQFGLGIGVNLYVTLPDAGEAGHAAWFGNGPLLAFHAALGLYLILAAIFVLARAIMPGTRPSSSPRPPGWWPSSSPPSSAPASPTSSPTATPSAWRSPLQSRWPATPSAYTPPARGAADHHDRAQGARRNRCLRRGPAARWLLLGRPQGEGFALRVASRAAICCHEWFMVWGAVPPASRPVWRASLVTATYSFASHGVVKLSLLACRCQTAPCGQGRGCRRRGVDAAFFQQRVQGAGAGRAAVRGDGVNHVGAAGRRDGPVSVRRRRAVARSRRGISGPFWPGPGSVGLGLIVKGRAGGCHVRWVGNAPGLGWVAWPAGSAA
jgi:hypothetical protein